MEAIDNFFTSLTFNSEILGCGKNFQDVVPLQKPVTLVLWTDHPVVNERKRLRRYITLLDATKFLQIIIILYLLILINLKKLNVL